MSEKVYFTAEGLEALKVSLVEMNERRMKVAAAIEHARSLGDLKENAEYHSAKEEAAMLHARIKDASHKIACAALIEDADIDTSKVFIGAKVTVFNAKTKKELEWMLVGPAEADMAKGKISTASPVGQALLGKSVGEKAKASVPAGDLVLEIRAIHY